MNHKHGFGLERLRIWLLLGAAAVSSTAHAAGLEDTMPGTIGLGRAASALRVSDFMATWVNPANLATISGGDLGGELRLPIMQSCFDRAKDNARDYRVNDATMGYAGSESFDVVCNDAAPFPTGNLGWAKSFDTGWGYGIGFFTPALVPSLHYGSTTIVTQSALPDETLPTTPDGVESPNRFLLIERKVLGGFLQAGLGAQPIRQLRLGVAFGIGFANVKNVSMASVLGGTFRDQELLNDVRVTDPFIPHFTASVVVTPIEALEVMAALTYQDDVRATGTLELTANGIQGDRLRNCRSTMPGTHCTIDDFKLTIPFPTLEAVLGVRYAQRRNAQTATRDPMRDEVWDVELNGYWSETSHVEQYALDVYSETPGSKGAPTVAFSSSPKAVPLALPPTASIPRHWRDTFGVRFGGEYNILPSKLSARAGVAYEGRAVPVEYMNIDSWPIAKLSLHIGGTVAFDRVRLSLAYAHVFYQPVEMDVGAGKVLEIVSQSQNKAQAVNEGYYSTSQDILSGQLNVAF
jgi:hypothetical protein